MKVVTTTVYDEVNFKVEKMANKMISSAKIVFPMFVVPVLAQSYINYYVKGLAEEAFIVSYLSA